MEWLNNVLGAIGDWFVQKGPELAQWFGSIGMNILKAVLVLVLGWWLSVIFAKLLRSALKKAKVEVGITSFVYSAAKVLLKVIVVISAIAMLDVNITSIITALGAAGITLGLAMKDSLSNFASGVVILFNKPFQVGDYIDVDGSRGHVTKIDLMYTSINTNDNKEVIFPNSMLTSSKVANCTRNESRRLEMRFTASYDADVELVKRCIRASCSDSKYVLQNEPTVVGIREFAASGVIYELRTWINSDDYWDAYFDMQERVKAYFDQNHVEIPRDKLDVRMIQK